MDETEDRAGGEAHPGTDRDYNSLLVLEDLESLLEDADEAGIEGSLTGRGVPDEIAAQARTLGVDTLDALQKRIADLHRSLDEAEDFD